MITTARYLWMTMLLVPTLVHGQDFIFPGTDYDTAVPHMRQVNGFDFGERITMHHEAMAYAKALADASPRVSIRVRGKTWEGREMILLFVTSAANQVRLQQFQEGYQAIADPRTTDATRFEALTEDLPVLVWLQESVHGDEISGTDSGLALARHLAAARDNTEIQMILDESVLVIEVMQNPDGRDRFVSYSRQNRSPGGSPDPQAAEHQQGWARGRFNHYLFDMNRDWFAMSQRETRVKVASFLAWYPQVVVDLHEMGSESSFFAANPSVPLNPILPQATVKQYEAFGKAVGEALDQRGIDYFHSEIFDGFYPGYGESWPSLHGAMGVLFEQASARGLVYRKRDGSLLTHQDAVRNQAIASYALLRHAARNRKQMLTFFYQNRKSAVEDIKENRQIFLLPGQDPSRAVRLAALLKQQGIEVEQIKEPIKSLSVKTTDKDTQKIEIPAHSILVRFNQPAGFLARTLLLDRVEMDADFLKRQKELAKKRKRMEIYDVTAWSLPMLFGVPTALAAGNGWKGTGSARIETPHRFHEPEAKLGYLIPNSLAAGQVISDLLQRKVKLAYTDKPIRHLETDFPRGSLLIKRKNNPADLPQILAEVGEKYDITIMGTNTSLFEKGPGFGSDEVVPIIAPKIAMLWNRPTAPMSAGWMRYLMEQHFRYPLTALRVESLARYRLEEYDVILVPESSPGNLQGTLGKAGSQKLIGWLRDGGVLVTVGRSTEWLLRKDVGLLDSAVELRGGAIDEPDKGKNAKKPITDPVKMVEPEKEYPYAASGTLLRVRFDPEHWMAYGMNESQAAMVDSGRILRPLRMNSGENPGRFSGLEDLLLSGFILDDTLAQFAHKPFLMVKRHGRGILVAFTEDPNYRAFMHGLLPLMSNAVFLGPARTF